MSVKDSDSLEIIYGVQMDFLQRFEPSLRVEWPPAI